MEAGKSMPGFNEGEILHMKKKHPCGSDEWEVIRAGADLKLKCAGCGRIIIMERRDAAKRMRT